MDYQKTCEKMKEGVRNLVTLYAILGSLSMLGTDSTGHYSADIRQGKAHLSTLEKKMYEPFFNKYNIETDLLKK